jgi:hypothetical protein
MHFNCGNPCCCSQESSVAEEEIEEDESRAKARTYKREGKLKDQQSTGRKRAARLYPLDETAPCEWLGLKFAGGGRFPIIGCASGTQQARHHGPDKNTLNNDEGNVHRICHKCHNRWHTLNDPEYDPGAAQRKHNSIDLATVEEVMNNEIYWVSKKTVKARD